MPCDSSESAQEHGRSAADVHLSDSCLAILAKSGCVARIFVSVNLHQCDQNVMDRTRYRSGTPECVRADLGTEPSPVFLQILLKNHDKMEQSLASLFTDLEKWKN